MKTYKLVKDWKKGKRTIKKGKVFSELVFAKEKLEELIKSGHLEEDKEIKEATAADFAKINESLSGEEIERASKSTDKTNK